MTGGAAHGAPVCNLVPQLRDVTINQGLNSYTPLAWGKDTLVRLYMSQPSCAATGALIQITGSTLTISGGGVANRTITAPTPALVSVFPAIATYSTAPAADSTGDVKFDAPGTTLSPAGTETGFTATFTASVTYSAQPNSRTAPTTGTVTFTTRPGTTSAITAPVAKKTNALRVLVVPMGDPTQPYNTQLTSAGQAEIERGMLTLSRVYPLRDGIATLTDTSPAALAAGLRYSISPTLLDVSSTYPPPPAARMFCGNSTNFTTLRGLLAQFLQAFNVANPNTPADRVLGVGDQAVTQGIENGCDDGRAAINGNEAWARLVYDPTGATVSRTGAIMAMELAHTMGAVPAGRNDGAFHSLYTNADYLSGDLNRAFNVATRSVLNGTNQDHTVMRFVTPWNNTNTILEKADWGLLLCRFGGPVTSDCATAGTVGSAAAGPAFVMSGTTSGTAGLSCAGSPTCVGSASGTTVVESYFSTSVAGTLADPTSSYHLVQKRNGVALGAPFGNQGVPVTTSDSHHDNTNSETASGDGLFSIALPFDTSADRIELWKGTPGASGSLLLYARNTSAAPTVTSMSSGGPIVESLHSLRAKPTQTARGEKVLTLAVKAAPRFVRAIAAGARATGTIVFLAAGTTERVSVSTGGTQGDHSSFNPAISADGRYVVFNSGASTLVSGDTNNLDDAFVRDRQTNTTERVSVDSSGVQGNGASFGGVSISADGRYVAFTSDATNLVPSDTNGVADTFVKDRSTGAVERVSVSTAGDQADGTSIVGPLISSDGRYVAFASRATNLVAGDSNGNADIFVRDRVSNTTERVSVATGGGQTGGADTIGGISADGRYVTFVTAASDVVPSDTNGLRDVFLHDRSTEATERISVATGGAEGTGGTAFGTQGGSISSDGKLVAFRSDDTNLVAGDDNGVGDIFLRDRSAGTTARVSVSSSGTQANAASDVVSMSDDGNFIAFTSSASNLVTGDTNGAPDVFLRDQGASTTEVVSLANDGSQANGSSTQADVSNDGRFIAFGSDASNLVSGDTNSATDVFVRDRSGTAGGGGPFVVNTLADHDDGTCDATDCSLREAINAANAHSNGTGGPDQITFAIPGTGSQQIAVSGSALPPITDPVVIDGDTQRAIDPGIPASTKAIVLNGDGAGATADGLVLAAGSGGSEIKGLSIHDFKCATAAPDPCTSGFGIVVQSDGNTIDGNYIGLGAAGDSPASNNAGGLLLAGSSNTIGGTTAAARNVIAGNAVAPSVRSQIDVTGNSNTIEGNYIGVAADGTTEYNEVTAITLEINSQHNTIGGLKTVGNIILGRVGVEIRANSVGSGNIVAGNNIGLDASGGVHAEVLPGIHISGTGSIIGDNISPPGVANPDRGNVIVGRSSDAGIFLEGASNAKITGNFIGTNRSGASGMGNAQGIRVSGGGSNTLGPGNTIAFNSAEGIFIGSATNRVVANSIHDNGGLGIRNSSPFVAPPTITRATKSGGTTTANGTFSGTPNSSFFIEFFDNSACDPSGSGEGQSYVGFLSVTTNGAGAASWTWSSPGLDANILTATATGPDSSTSEFSACKTVVTSTTPPGQQEFVVGASDDHAQDDVLDLYLDCGPGKGKFPVAIALPPSSSTATTANWSYNYDPSLACGGGKLEAVVNDGFQQSGFTAIGTAPVDSSPKPPISAILSPATGKTFLQYSVIPLKGAAFDPEQGALSPSWKLIRNSDSVVVRTASGTTTADLSPGVNGWTPGAYTVEMTATDADGNTTTARANITIVADADNDGIPASVEGGCLGGSDTNPLDAYGDKDGDGIPNGEDPDPCTPQGTYNAVATFQPNPFPVPSSGNTVNVTIQVPYRTLAQVLATSVAITRINDDVVNFKNVSWKVTNNVGQALFDRQALASYFTSHNIHNRTVLFTITGSSAAPPWSFMGVASTFVAG